MITIANAPLPADFIGRYEAGSPEREMLDIWQNSSQRYNFASLERLEFEIKLRREIIDAAEALYRSGLRFDVFRESKVNPAFWLRKNDGGWYLKPGVKASDAIRDIYENGRKYGTECATAMQIVYYKALLEIFPEETFNRMFKEIELMNWNRIHPILRDVGQLRRAADHLPGDRLYIKNPDVDPETPEWQGENIIDLSGGYYYGHGVGRHKLETFIKSLNQNRRKDAQESAYLMETAARPDFDRLFSLWRNAQTS